MAAYVCQNGQSYANNCRIAGTHTVHAIVKITSVAYCHYHKGCHEYEEYPSCSCTVSAQETEHIAIAQIVILNKRDSCYGAFYGLFLVCNLFCGILDFSFHILAYNSIRTEP